MNLLKSNSRQIEIAAHENNFWPSLFLFAEIENEGFADVEIVTLQQYKYDLALEQAFNDGATLENVEQKAQAIAATLKVSEFIETFSAKVRVVLNTPRVDDYVIQKVITILTRVDEFVPGQRIFINELIGNQHTHSIS